MNNIYCDNINTLGYEQKQNAYIALLLKLGELIIHGIHNIFLLTRVLVMLKMLVMDNLIQCHPKLLTSNEMVQYKYSRTSVAQTLMARLPRLFQTRS